MKIITIREGQQTAEGFTATVSIDGQTQYPITVSDPFSGQQEKELEFYFEEWIRFPFDGQVKARRAAASVKGYGEALFGEVFADADAYSDYKLACREGLTNLRIEIEGESLDFQALHWEALKDPKQPRPLAIDAVFTRKRYQRGVMPIELKPSAVINLLVVTARPNEEKDVGYRTVSRPLMDAIALKPPYLLLSSWSLPPSSSLRGVHANLKENWGEHIVERKFSWALMKLIATECHLYHPEKSYQSFKEAGF